MKDNVACPSVATRSNPRRWNDRQANFSVTVSNERRGDKQSDAALILIMGGANALITHCYLLLRTVLVFLMTLICKLFALINSPVSAVPDALIVPPGWMCEKPERNPFFIVVA